MKTTSLWVLSFALILNLSCLSSDAQSQTNMIVSLASSNPEATSHWLESQGFDVLEQQLKNANSLQVVVSPADLAALQGMNLKPALVRYGQPLRPALGSDAPPTGYLDLAAITAQMNAVAAANPTICQVVDLTALYGMPTTFEGRHLLAMKISDNVTMNEDEPNFLMVSAHHARETVTPVLALDAIDRLVAGYGSDPAVTAAVDNYEIWIAPVWNPDGYEYVFSTDDSWRKNRRVFPTGVGVDQNRNYLNGWNAPCSGSTTVSSGNYKGPSPASEPETQTMLAFSDDRRFAKVLDYHSSGRETLYSYNCQNHPMNAFLAAEAATLSTQSGYGGATRPPSADGEHYHDQLERGSFAFLTETATSFQPAYTTAQAEAALVWPGTLWLLARPISLEGHVTDAVTGNPLDATIEVQELVFSNGESFSSGGNFGRYDMILPTGNFNVKFSAIGYQTQTIPISVTAASTQLLDVALTPAMQDSGQPNSIAARLDITAAVDINGFPSAQQNGPFFSNLPANSVMELRFEGEALQPFALLAGPLNRNSQVIANVGSLDLGLIPNYGDLTLVLDGSVPRNFLDTLARIGPNGSQTFSYHIPALLGPWTTLQALVYSTTTLPQFSAATEITIY